MFMHKRLWIVAPLVIASLTLVAACVVYAQDAAPAPAPASEPASAPAETATGPAETSSAPAEIEVSDKDLAGLWSDFIHYITLARTDVARSYGQAILKKQPKPQDVYALSMKTPNAQKRLSDAAAQSPELKKIVESIRALIEQGYQAERGNPEQIVKTIQDLGGGLRAYENAAQRLVVSGEFALPQLVQKLGAANTPGELKQRIVNVLVRMGKDAVNGLNASLSTDNDEMQVQLSGVLAKIGYKQAVPYLKELSIRKGVTDSTRAKVCDALATLIGRPAAAKSLAELSYEYAQRYYNHEQSLMPDARMSNANVWYWQEGLGLTYKPVPAVLFPDIYAMRLAKMALENESKFDQAMALWLAANFRREANLQGFKDPTVPENMPSARFFALASPPEILQDVLSRGLKTQDSVVAAGAIEALVRTQGAKSLVQPVAGGAQPLVEAMSFPSKQIRYQAAIALANAMPDKAFNGSDLVLTVLNDALRMNTQKVAILVTADEKTRNETKDALRAANFDVVDVSEAGKAIAVAKPLPGVDLVVVEPAAAADVVPAMRRECGLVSVPVIVTGDDEKARNQLKGDALVSYLGGKAKLQDVLEKIFGKAGETQPAEQGTTWAIRVAETARMLALTNNCVYNLVRLRPALIANLNSSSAEVQTASARALAAMSSPEAQQAVANLALKQDLDEKLRVEMLNILTESVRKFGNQLAEQQVNSVYTLVSSNASAAVREAAAQAWGSLNLPSEKSKALILQFAPKS